MTPCPHCGMAYCKACYPVHRKMEQMAPLLANPRVPGKTSQTKTTIWDSAFAANSNPAQMMPVPRLRDAQGTPAPAAANPFIFKRGTGRPDEPPEAAGAPNRPPKDVATTMIIVHAK